MEKLNVMTKDDLFDFMCKCDSDIMRPTNLVSIPAISKILGFTKYRIRKLMKELKDSGMVISGCESLYSSYDERFYIIRGFELTKKALNTDTYKEIQQKEK